MAAWCSSWLLLMDIMLSDHEIGGSIFNRNKSFISVNTCSPVSIQWNPVFKIPEIPAANLIIIPSGIILHRENCIQKKVHRIPEISQIPAGQTGIRPE